MLDRNREYGTYMAKVDGITVLYLTQDGKNHDPDSGLEVNELGVIVEGEPEPVPNETELLDKPQEVMTCNLCGKQYKLGPTEKTKNRAVQRVKNHMKKEHGIEL